MYSSRLCEPVVGSGAYCILNYTLMVTWVLTLFFGFRGLERGFWGRQGGIERGFGGRFLVLKNWRKVGRGGTPNI